MAQTDPTPRDPIGNHSEPKSGGPGALSRWMQRNANARTNRKTPARIARFGAGKARSWEWTSSSCTR